MPTPIVVSATGEAGLPSTQAEVDARRAARIAKQHATGITKRITKRKPRKSVTDSMTHPADKLWSSIERRMIKVVPTPVPEWPGAPLGMLVVLPGTKGHSSYIYNIKERLKAVGFQWNAEMKLWYLDDAEGAPPQGWGV